MQSTDPDELGIIRSALHLTDDLAAVLDEIPTRPHAIVHDDAVEIVSLAPTDDPDDDPIPFQILVGDGWAITHHDREIPFLDGHRDSIRWKRWL